MAEQRSPAGREGCPANRRPPRACRGPPQEALIAARGSYNLTEQIADQLKQAKDLLMQVQNKITDAKDDESRANRAIDKAGHHDPPDTGGGV